MDGTSSSTDDSKVPESQEATRPRLPEGLDIIAWALISAGLLAFITVGSVDTRVWRFGRLRVEPRSVLGIWEYQVDNLPRVAHQWVLDGLVVGAIVVFLLGVCAAVWLLICEPGTQHQGQPVEGATDAPVEEHPSQASKAE